MSRRLAAVLAAMYLLVMGGVAVPLAGCGDTATTTTASVASTTTTDTPPTVLETTTTIEPTTTTLAQPKDGDRATVTLGEAVSGLSLLMAVIGLWLLLLGRMRVGRVLMEGKRAFAVGPALFLPFVVSVAVEQLGLWSWISWGAVVAGLVLAVLAYLTVASTRVGGDRRAASGLLLGGAILMVIGLGIPKPSDAEGLFLLNPFSGDDRTLTVH